MSDPLDRFNFQRKKTVHVNLSRKTHAEFRIELFKRSLSMQETFEEFAGLVGSGNPATIKILDRLVEKKRNKEVSRLSCEDAEEIYRILEEEGPQI